MTSQAGRRMGGVAGLLSLFSLVWLVCFVGGTAAGDDHAAVMGVDIGITYARVGIFRDTKRAKLEILPDVFTARFSPPYVAFTDGGPIFGSEARAQVPDNPANTLFGVSKLMGRRFSDISAAVLDLPYKVVNADDRPLIQLSIGGREKLVTPEEVYGMVLARMREVVEEYLGTNVTKAVVAVPASMDDAQRTAVRNASEAANLYVGRILNRTAAAAIGYGLDQRLDESNILICDFDESLTIHFVNVDDGVFEHGASSNDIPLGIVPDRLFERALDAVADVRKAALRSFGWDGIDHLIMTGNSAMIPAFRGHLEQRLGIRAANASGALNAIGDVRTVNPIGTTDAIATGAAYQARIIFNPDSGVGCTLQLPEMNPFGLGVETAGGVMATLIPRYTALPARGSLIFTAAASDQTTAWIRVFHGDRALTRHNELLAEFGLGIAPPPNSKGASRIEVVIEYGSNYDVRVVASDVGSGQRVEVFIPGVVSRDWGGKDIGRYADEHLAGDEAVRQLIGNCGITIDGGPESRKTGCQVQM